MRVAVDLLAQVPGQTGTTAYWAKMLYLLPAIDPSVEYFVFVTPEHERRYRATSPNLHFVPAPYRATSILERLRYQEWQIPRFCDAHDITVHWTCNPTPVFRGMRAIQVWMILSLQYFVSPGQVDLVRAAYWTLASRVKARRSAAIVANSADCAKTLQKAARLPASKTVTIYEALDHDLFYPAPAYEAIPSRRFAPEVRRPYVLNVSDNRPYKRQLDLIHAFAELRRTGAAATHQLVIVGRDYMGYRDALRRAADSLGVGEDVVFVDPIPIDALPGLYRAADLFVYPSELETFGIPPLEAMACGVPTIVSDRSAVVEVSGGGACVVDPDDHAALAHAMTTLLSERACRDERIAAGLAWAARFRWDRHAVELVQLFRRLASEHGTR